MKKASDEEKFEVAAVYRNKLENFNYLLNQYNPVGKYIENPNYLNIVFKNEAADLLNHLASYFPTLKKINHIECFDISNISGKSATGSMITFIKGKPEKKLYRRFKIKSVYKPDDFAMLTEIMDRRLGHAEWKLPDLMLIDGGKPQLQAITKALTIYKIDVPAIGLAKLYEEVVIPKNRKFYKLKLPEDSQALHLLQRIRDEAHRFAHKYHTAVHLQKLMN